MVSDGLVDGAAVDLVPGAEDEALGLADRGGGLGEACFGGGVFGRGGGGEGAWSGAGSAAGAGAGVGAGAAVGCDMAGGCSESPAVSERPAVRISREPHTHTAQGERCPVRRAHRAPVKMCSKQNRTEQNINW